jgi:hypothetical protein
MKQAWDNINIGDNADKRMRKSITDMNNAHIAKKRKRFATQQMIPMMAALVLIVSGAGVFGLWLHFSEQNSPPIEPPLSYEPAISGEITEPPAAQSTEHNVQSTTDSDFTEPSLTNEPPSTDEPTPTDEPQVTFTFMIPPNATDSPPQITTTTTPPSSRLDTPTTTPPRTITAPPPVTTAPNTSCGICGLCETCIVRIKQDYLKSTNQHERYTIGLVPIINHLGTYNGSVAVYFGGFSLTMPTSETVAGYTFYYSGIGPTVLVWNNGNFYGLSKIFDLGLLTSQEIGAINSAWNKQVQFEPYTPHAMECYEISGLIDPSDLYNCVSGRIPGWVCSAARRR